MDASPTNSLDMAFEKGLQLSFPPVMIQLMQTLLEPDPSFGSIAELLKLDPLLAGKVLHVVNSASYGFEHTINDLERAAIAIGTGDLFRLVMSLSMQKRLQPASREPDLVFGDWRMTLWAALGAEALAKHSCPAQAREAYLAGMLKDLPLLLALCRAEVPDFLDCPRFAVEPEPGDEVRETVFWGRTHPEQAGDIFQAWNMPDALAKAVIAHHDMAGVLDYPPLTRCVIFATRWAELLHGMNAHAGKLVAFELALGAEWGFSARKMESFRAECGEAFNRLLGQLGINQARPETRLHEQSLSSIQSYYCLALELLGPTTRAVAGSASGRSGPVASYGASHGASYSTSGPVFRPGIAPLAGNLKHQLRLFWGVTEWGLRLALPDAEPVAILCREGAFSGMNDALSAFTGPCAELPIASGNKQYGSLFVPGKHLADGDGTLPLFAHMLGICLEDQEHRLGGAMPAASLSELPFVLARLDRDGILVEATPSMMDVLGLREIPDGQTAAQVFEQRIGFCPVPGREDDGEARGAVVLVPGRGLPATPLYLSRLKASNGYGYLLLGELPELSETDALGLVFPGLWDSLLERVGGHVCVLDHRGNILWADSGNRDLPGKSIFSLTRPEGVPDKVWDATVLDGVGQDLPLSCLVTGKGGSGRRELHFSLLGGVPRRFLLHIRPAGDEDGDAPEGGGLVQAFANNDGLTGLPGYARFHAFVQHIVAMDEKGRGTGILFYQLASLREYNRRHGVPQGDALLRRVADNLAATCRPGLDHPFRYGAGKFAVVMPEASRVLLESLADTMRRRMGETPGAPSRAGIGLGLIPAGGDVRQAMDSVRQAAREAQATQKPFAWTPEG